MDNETIATIQDCLDMLRAGVSPVWQRAIATALANEAEKIRAASYTADQQPVR